MFFIPYRLDVFMENSRLANIVLIILCSLVYFLGVYTPILNSVIPDMVLKSGDLSGLLGHMFLHAGFMHLIGNMVYLWVFGNAICSKIGSGWFVYLFLGLGIFSAIIHNIFDGAPAIGASGAIYGIIGFYIALYPTNKISCFWWFLIRGGLVEISSYLLIGFWVLKDIFGLFGTESNIAHVAHIGGFVGGSILGYFLLKSDRIVMNGYDLKTLPDIL